MSNIVDEEILKTIVILNNDKHFNRFTKWLVSRLKGVQKDLLYADETFRVSQGRAVELTDLLEAIGHARDILDKNFK